ncbi:MAG TPA: general stress protein, partial [Patescibacteria group bacterium]|nr:general stress protein [Patescibacteria group bacterium]
MKTVVGLYDDFQTAQSVVSDLVNAGFDRANISLLANDAEGRHSSSLNTTSGPDTDTTSGAAKGAAGGAVVGGVGGLLLGLGALAIPGLGPIIAAGPIVAALTGAGIGAAAGGVLGALTDLGVPDDEAEYYAEGVRRGGTLVTLKTSEDLVERAIDIMDHHGAVDIQDRVENWRQSGWNGFNPNEQHYSNDQVSQFR